jgi:hypothetical protein
MMLSDGIIQRGIVMGNVQPVGKTTSTTPRPERPRNPRPIFGCVLGETAEALAPHSEAQSPTVTPLPSNPPIVLMTPEGIGTVGSASQASETVAPLSCQEIDALLPARPKRKEVAFGPLDYRPSDDGKFLEFEFTVEGLSEDDLLTMNVWGFFRRKLRDEAFVFSDPVARSGRNGAVIAFRGAVTAKETDIELMCEKMLKRVFHVFDLAHNVFLNLQDLGILDNDHGLHNDPDVGRIMRRPSWRCSSKADDDLAVRYRSMLFLLSRRYYEAGVTLLSDLLSVWGQTLDWVSRSLSFYVDHHAPACAQTSGSAQLDHFVRLLCLDERIVSSWEFQCQVGRIVLRELATSENNASALKLHHVILFDRFAEFRRLFPDLAKPLLRELLDLSAADRVSLFRSPKARKLLLIAFPELRRVFERIEQHDYRVFRDRRHELEDKHGFHFGGQPMSNAPISVTCSGPVDFGTIDLLLDLADAAAMCAGQIGWAIGVLQFLSDRVLDDAQFGRAKALHNLIQMAVRFDPDELVAATFRAVRTQTDNAIDSLKWLDR